MYLELPTGMAQPGLLLGVALGALCWALALRFKG